MDNSVKDWVNFQHSYVLIDAEGRLVDWDEGFEREWFGLQPNLKRGARYHDVLRETLLTPAARGFAIEVLGHDNVDAVIGTHLQGLGTTRSFEYSFQGVTICVEERATVFGGVQRIARNVTEERRNQKDLADAKQYQRFTADADKSGVYAEVWRTPDGEYSGPPISEELARLFRLPPEMVGTDASTILSRMNQSDEEIGRMRAAFEEAARISEIYSYEFFIKDDDGGMRWMRQSLIPRREEDGTVIFSGVIRDVTREKEAEENVELLRSVVVRSFDSVLILESESDERNTKVLYVNPKFEQLYGQTGTELVGESIEKLIFLIGNLEEAQSAYMAVVRGEQESAELELTRADGHKFWVEIRADIIQRLEDGRYRWVMISRDVSERRHAVEELVRAKNAAEYANQAKGEFLANMSHELRTPLNAIIGFSELIDIGVKRNGWENGYVEYIEDIVSSGRHLLELINSVLDLSKIEAGSLSLNLDTVDLDAIIRSSVAVMSGLAQDARVQLTIQGEIGMTDFIGDELKLKQVLLNIISNAIKFTPEGGAVTVLAQAEMSDATISIIDTGCGIAATDLDRIGEPFVQVDSSISRKHSGSGLGLSIAKQLCNLHGGSLKLTSIAGQGTTVRIRLPRVAPTN
jgi:PAS domain S-box-containing protein